MAMTQLRRSKQGIRSPNQSLAAVVSKGLNDDEEEGYYSSEEEPEADEDTVRRCLGEAGSVTVADLNCNTCVLDDLRLHGDYSDDKRRLGHSTARGGGHGRQGQAISWMMEEVRTTTKGVKHTTRAPTPTALLRPNSKEK